MFITPGTRSDHRTTLLRGRARGPLRDIGNSGTTKLLDLQHAPFGRFVMKLTANVTMALQRPVDGGTYAFLIDTGAGSFTVTWPATVLWPAGTAPVITTTNNKVDLVTLIYRESANKYYGSFNQAY